MDRCAVAKHRQVAATDWVEPVSWVKEFGFFEPSFAAPRLKANYYLYLDLGCDMFAVEDIMVLLFQISIFIHDKFISTKLGILANTIPYIYVMVKIAGVFNRN